ncbi:MAG TPA: hypothetical protein PKW08_04635 [Flavobacteriaceae bacterium]|nr:hypothetical protein [Flavobacteriaceae bacterium]MCB9212510.1 hypothetical protein [Alteromonas sp.]HPF10573.1 hypothetical protein [Flavobacteriaceae bacterium]HQU20855.1 hypothetical protein [Flavobacteriaceae bacterium]HQU64339.1 hypothetical protein [Flavobacteriaceae bacterium]
MKHFKKPALLLTVIAFIAFLGCSKGDDPNNDNNNGNVTITVANFTISIPENPQVGVVLGTLQVTSNASNLQYAILQQSPAGAVALNASTGQLTVADASAFDFETNATISGTVKVSQGNVSKQASFSITLEDVDETLVCEGDIYLLTQEDVIALGNSGCSTIDGTLWIASYPVGAITDLSPLSAITTITESLFIKDTGLVNLSGLDQLTYVGGNVELYSNLQLQSLSGLGLTEFGPGIFRIYDCDALTSLEGLENLTEASGTFDIGNNENLASLDGFNISSVTEFYQLGITIQVNPNLTNIEAMQSLGSELTGHLFFHANQSLQSLEGLHLLTSVSQGITLEANNALTNLHGLRSLTNTPNLIIYDNQSLNSISDLSNFTQGGVNLLSNDSLLSLDGLQNLSSPTYFIMIECDAITSLDGLQIIQINGHYPSGFDSLFISYNASLSNLDALASIEYISNDLQIFHNPQITNLDGFANMTLDPDNNDLQFKIYDNILLTDFCGLMTVENLPTNIHFTGNGYNPSYDDIQDGNCSL